MDTVAFDSQVGALTASLGDTTRRGVYIAVRQAAEPVTVAEVATLFGLHPNVARHHLDRLVADGWLEVAHRRGPERSGGPGAGRPAKHYEASAKEVSLEFPRRRYDLLAELLVRVVERLEPERAAEVAEEIGREYGRQIADEVGLPEDAGFDVAVTAVAKAMMGVGFETEAQPEDRTLLTRFCPFGDTAANHPEIVCRIDQGIVKGLLEAAHEPGVALVTPHEITDEARVTEL
jgi:predicted ArsR family transcriptional regulator